MLAKTLSLPGNWTLVFGSAVLLTGLFVVVPAHAATSTGTGSNSQMATSRQGTGQKASSSTMSATQAADNDGDSDNTGSPSATKSQKAKRTNQTTGAPDKNPGHLSNQKGNQPKSAVKTD